MKDRVLDFTRSGSSTNRGKEVIVILQEDDERLRGILVEMAGTVTEEYDEQRICLQDDGTDIPMEEQERWEDRRDRLGLGNRCVSILDRDSSLR